ncbi:hypothetical protein AB4Z52_13710 [Rhizobium sp. 2YAF20]|uniref:hypothetical protein n=1 Tax=Rhizobium sp. 2YAF20 TaxID=3233027 RepID=UPI003F9D38A8
MNSITVKLLIERRTATEIATELGRTALAVSIKGSRSGLFALTREELSEPGLAVRTCINPTEHYPFVSTGIYNRTCSACKKTQAFQAE